MYHTRWHTVTLNVFVDRSSKRGQPGVSVCWYYRPEQTFHPAHRQFWEGEVFKTSTQPLSAFPPDPPSPHLPLSLRLLQAILLITQLRTSSRKSPASSPPGIFADDRARRIGTWVGPYTCVIRGTMTVNASSSKSRIGTLACPRKCASRRNSCPYTRLSVPSTRVCSPARSCRANSRAPEASAIPWRR